MSKSSVGEILNSARLAINNAMNDTDIQAQLTELGYDAAKMAVGEALLNEAEVLTQQQIAIYGHQFAASQALKVARQEVKAVYNRALKVARVAFQNDVQATAALLLNGIRKQSFGLWYQQSATFYGNLLADTRLLAVMTTYGYTSAKLTGEQTAVRALQGLNEAQEKYKGEAQAATKLRNAKMRALTVWLADFRKIAAVALLDDSQKLEALGFGPVE
jgi:hypothetical protein